MASAPPSASTSSSLVLPSSRPNRVADAFGSSPGHPDADKLPQLPSTPSDQLPHWLSDSERGIPEDRFDDQYDFHDFRDASIGAGREWEAGSAGEDDLDVNDSDADYRMLNRPEEDFGSSRSSSSSGDHQFEAVADDDEEDAYVGELLSEAGQLKLEARLSEHLLIGFQTYPSVQAS